MLHNYVRYLVTDLADVSKVTAFSFPVDAPQIAKNSGWGIRFGYILGKGFTLSAKVTENQLNNGTQLKKDDPWCMSCFNSPKIPI